MLKILQLHGARRGLRNARTGAVFGGLAKQVLDTHALLISKGIEIRTVTAASDELESAGFFVLNPEPSSAIWANKRSYETYCKALVDYALATNVTNIVVHGANRLAKALTSLGVPYLFIEHSMDSSINKRYHEEHFGEVIPKAREQGSKFYSVSQYAKENIERRVREQQLSKNFEFDGYLKLQYPTDELLAIKVCDGNGSAITIGRCDANKNPAAAISFLGNRMPLKIYAVKSDDNPKEQSYFEKKLKQHSSSSILRINHNREEMLQDLAVSSIYISTSPNESAGITAFEALCLGIPVVLMTNKPNHASLMFAPNEADYIRCMDPKGIELDWIEKMGKLTVADRQNIRNQTIDHNDAKHVVDDILAALETMEPLKI